jgi:hypothetical protein
LPIVEGRQDAAEDEHRGESGETDRERKRCCKKIPSRT